MRHIIIGVLAVATLAACGGPERVQVVEDYRDGTETYNQTLLSMTWDITTPEDKVAICDGIDLMGYEPMYESFVEGAGSEMVSIGEFTTFFEETC